MNLRWIDIITSIWIGGVFAGFIIVKLIEASNMEWSDVIILLIGFLMFSCVFLCGIFEAFKKLTRGKKCQKMKKKKKK